VFTSWVLANYKSVYERTALDLKPLTLFVGANNAGKSTFIQSMLLTAQTLSDQLTLRPVVLNGRQVRVGAFSGIVSAGSGNQTVTIGFSADGKAQAPKESIHHYFPSSSPLYRGHGYGAGKVDCEFSFTSSVNAAGDASDLQTSISECRLIFSDGENEDVEVHVRRSEKSVQERLDEAGSPESVAGSALPESLAYEVITPTEAPQSEMAYYSPYPTIGKVVGATFSHFVPIGLTVTYDAEADSANKIVQTILAGRARTEIISHQYAVELPDVLARIADVVRPICEARREARSDGSRHQYYLREFLRLLSAGNHRDALSAILQAIRISPSIRRDLATQSDALLAALQAKRPPKQSLGMVPLDYAGLFSLQHLFSEKLRYLAPLRDEPKAVYPFDGAVEPGSVGLRGEYTAAALELYGNIEVSYIRPPTNLEVNGQGSAVGTLHSAVTEWLDYLGVVTDVHTSDKGVFGHELTVAVHGDDGFHTLPHVGVGVSQVLPILVMCLLCNPGTTVVLEQPELHLHPGVQARLGDFFIALALSGKQCIVETHSEYLINRLRLRAVQDESDRIAELARLFFVEKTGKASTYRPGSITEFGALSDWPVGFFDQGPDDSREILLAAIAKREQRKGSRA